MIENVEAADAEPPPEARSIDLPGSKTDAQRQTASLTSLGIVATVLPGWRLVQGTGERRERMESGCVDQNALSELVGRYADRKLKKWVAGELRDL